MTNETLKAGDKVLVQNEWTPEGRNAGTVVDLNAKNIYGVNGMVLVAFEGQDGKCSCKGSGYVYLPRNCTKIVF